MLPEIDGLRSRGRPGRNGLPAHSLAATGRIRLKKLITHRYPLEDFADAYAAFTERRDGALKVIVRPAAAA